MRPLFDFTHRHPPPGFSPPGTEQIIRADQELWRQVSSHVKHEFAARGGHKLVDKALLESVFASSVVFHLLPFPTPPMLKISLSRKTARPKVSGKGEGQAGKSRQARERSHKLVRSQQS